METTRQNKIARLLQKELSEIFLGITRNMPGTLISTTRVRISPDLSIARVYLSIFPSDKAASVLEMIEAQTVAIRCDLAARVRHQLRIVPQLTFFIDDSLDYVEHIDELLKK